MPFFSRAVLLAATACALAACGGGGGRRADLVANPTPSDSPQPPTRTVQFDPALCAAQPGAPYGQTAGLAGTNLMVTSADINASIAGCKVLARGGSAIDAAITVQAVLGVAEPFASGMAGGSVVTYYD